MKKAFYIGLSKFDKPIQGTLKGSTKYMLSITFFWINLDFRIMNQDGSFFFRNEQLYWYYLKFKYRTHKF